VHTRICPRADCRAGPRHPVIDRDRMRRRRLSSPCHAGTLRSAYENVYITLMPARPRAPGRATILDVARRARVSPATVSRVMNDSARVSEAVTAAVLDAAARLDFRPNLVGRNLRAARTRNLGVVLPTLTHPVFAECLHGLEAAARAGEHAVMLATTGYDPAQEDGAIESLLRHRVDGLVLTVADAARSKLLDKLDREQVPYVLVYNQLGSRSARQRPTVSVDNRAAARQMVEHLIGLGHRRIAMVAGSFRQSDRARLRHRGYLDAMRAAGLTGGAGPRTAVHVDRRPPAAAGRPAAARTPDRAVLLERPAGDDGDARPAGARPARAARHRGRRLRRRAARIAAHAHAGHRGATDPADRRHRARPAARPDRRPALPGAGLAASHASTRRFDRGARRADVSPRCRLRPSSAFDRTTHSERGPR
jgi:DNA-binding LacI/PurR family transcriptional regulator